MTASLFESITIHFWKVNGSYQYWIETTYSGGAGFNNLSEAIIAAKAEIEALVEYHNCLVSIPTSNLVSISSMDNPEDFDF